MSTEEGHHNNNNDEPSSSPSTTNNDALSTEQPNNSPTISLQIRTVSDQRQLQINDLSPNVCSITTIAISPFHLIPIQHFFLTYKIFFCIENQFDHRQRSNS